MKSQGMLPAPMLVRHDASASTAAGTSSNVRGGDDRQGGVGRWRRRGLRLGEVQRQLAGRGRHDAAGMTWCCCAWCGCAWWSCAWCGCGSWCRCRVRAADASARRCVSRRWRRGWRRRRQRAAARTRC
eukprot:6212200-Pleurochrysis_carterae.AAC.5